jgi:hypothetical protein
VRLRPKRQYTYQVRCCWQESSPSGGVEIKPRELEFNTGPLSTVEGLIKTLPGVLAEANLVANTACAEVALMKTWFM